MISSTAISLLGGVFLILYLAYRAILPKPLPDIPYNHDAASKLFGDVPEVMAFVKSKKQIFVSDIALLNPSHQTHKKLRPGFPPSPQNTKVPSSRHSSSPGPSRGSSSQTPTKSKTFSSDEPRISAGRHFSTTS